MDVYGYVAEQTPSNAEYVAETKIQEWLDEGLTERQILLIWNQGHTGPCRAGVNKHGVAYDSCGYVEKVDRIYRGLVAIHMP